MSKWRLPRDSIIVESSLKWITDLLSHLDEEKTAKELVNYKQKLLDLFNASGDNVSVNDYDNETERIIHATKNLRTLFTFLSMGLDLAAIYTQLREFEEAEKVVNLLGKTLAHKSVLKYLTSPQNGYYKAFQFSIDTGKYQIAILKREMKKPGVNSYASAAALCSSKEIGVLKDSLQKSWSKLVQDNKFLATINCLKGALTFQLEKKDGNALKHFKKAIELDPECYIWHKFAYRAAREIRKDALEYYWKPSEEEWRFCKRAHELGNDDLAVILDYGIILKEILGFGTWSRWKDQTKFQECKEVFRKLIESATNEAPEWRQNGTLRAAQMNYANLLLYSEGNNSDKEKGKMLLEECLTNNPENYEVIYNMAKLYHMGTYRNHLFQDLKKAKEFYLKGLEKCPDHKACLMGLVKLLFDLGKYTNVIEAVDSFLQKSVGNPSHINVYILRGYILWLFNPFGSSTHKMEACHDWISCLIKYNEYSAKIYSRFRKPDGLVSSFIIWKKEFIEEVIQEMKEMVEFCNDVTRKIAICNFTEELVKPEYKMDRLLPPKRHFQHAPRRSEADKDTNWRRVV